MGYPQRMAELEEAVLFNVQMDPSERFDIAETYPEVIEQIKEMVAEHQQTMVKPESELDKFPRLLNK